MGLGDTVGVFREPLIQTNVLQSVESTYFGRIDSVPVKEIPDCTYPNCEVNVILNRHSNTTLSHD